MAAYFQLFPIGSTEAVTFAAVDEAICAHLGVEPDPVHYRAGWYDSIGFALAVGRDWTWMREHFIGDEIHRIIDFMEANYTADCWMGR